MADGADTHPKLETSASTPNSTSAPGTATKASKDRQCPFCGQAFTSSSLGRHLDLYIKSKNPKPPDGVHDVDEIRRIRGAITRRQPRSSLKATPGGGEGSGQDANGVEDQSMEPEEGPRRPEQSRLENEAEHHPESRRENSGVYTMLKPPVWQATGVINNIPPRAPSRGNSEAASNQAYRRHDVRRETEESKTARLGYEPENIWKLQDQAELGRTAEMALREVLGSLEAAQKKLDPKTLFDDFDFFSLSFPGLCLAMLPAPTTLFQQTPFPSGESWTLGPPGKRQYETMARYVNERCTHRRQTEYIADSVVFKHQAHLSGAWEHWQTLPELDCATAWSLEILRSFTRAQEQKKHLRAELDVAQQHIRHLETEFDRLSRCQLPREYLLHPPNTIPISKEVMQEVRSAQPKHLAAEMNYDVEALLSKWRAQIRATTRTSRIIPAPKPTTPGYNPSSNDHTMSEEMVMNGSVFGINGPMPRQGDMSSKQYATQDFDYETPSQPGGIVGAAEDEEGDADADGETEDVAGQHPEQNALISRHQKSPNGGKSPGNTSFRGSLNQNGKRQLTPNLSGSSRGTFKIYKERHDAADGRDRERTLY